LRNNLKQKGCIGVAVILANNVYVIGLKSDTPVLPYPAPKDLKRYSQLFHITWKATSTIEHY